MGELNTPIDVISVCSADGEIKPLRFRMEEEDHTLRRIDIAQVISTRKIQYVGIGPYFPLQGFGGGEGMAF